MLRDVPRIYGLLALAVLIVVGLTWYAGSIFSKDTDTLQLNDVIMTTTVSEVDQTSRIYEGVLLLADTFEVATWKRIDEQYPNGSLVQFDYLFDDKDTRFSVPNKSMSSPTYEIGGTGVKVPDVKRTNYTGLPVKAVRVKVREKGDKVGTWTYVATVEVDAASKSKK